MHLGCYAFTFQPVDFLLQLRYGTLSLCGTVLSLNKWDLIRTSMLIQYRLMRNSKLTKQINRDENLLVQNISTIAHKTGYWQQLFSIYFSYCFTILASIINKQPPEMKYHACKFLIYVT